MKELVQCPDATFRPVPWWCWTGELDMAEMDRQLRAMRAQGIREFIIFALYGLEFPFLGETWWQRIGWTLDRCEKLGLKVWIYDDYNWPSGTCAGRLLRDHPEVRAERFAIERVPVRPGERVVRDVADGWVGAFLDVPAGAARPLPAGAAPRGGRLAWTNRSRRPVSLVLVTRRPCAHAGVKSRGALWCEPQIGYLDTLNPKAVRLYRAAIHGEYEKRFRRYFGKTLVGFFTDEPQLSTSGGTYCSAALTDAFRKQYGYSLESHLHELLADAGQFPLTRYHFWSLATRLFADAYWRPVSRWCARRKLMHTGHLLGEECLAWTTTYSGDFFSDLKHLQAPGMDLLGGETSYDAGPIWRFGNLPRAGLIVTAKLLSGTARYAGRSRALCEAFGVLPWSQTLADQKHVLDWLCALGVNLINDNLLTYTIKGFRKRGGSGKHFSQPWWVYYRQFSDYTRRVCALAARGRLEADVAVLYPTTQAWCLMAPRGDTGMKVLRDAQPPALGRTEAALYAVSDALLRLHRGFELLFDDVLARARVSGGRLEAPAASSKTILLPGLLYLRSDVYERLCAFSRDGGQVIIVGEPPAMGVDPDRRRLQPLRSIPGALRLPLGAPADLEARLAAALPKAADAWDIAGPGARDVISAARSIPGGRALFLANQAPARRAIRIGWSFREAVSLWDPESGASAAVAPGHGRTRRRLRLDLAPGQSLVLAGQARRRTPKPQALPAAAAWALAGRARRRRGRVLKGPWRFAAEGPNLFLPQFRLLPIEKSAGSGSGGLPSGREPGWRRVSRSGDAGVELSPDCLAGFWLRAEFRLRAIPGDLAVVVDSADYGRVWLNGRSLVRRTARRVWDAHNLAFQAGPAARLGLNVLWVKVKPELHYADRIRTGSTAPSFVEPVALAGRFRVAAGHGIQTLEAPRKRLAVGSWTRQGYPHFAGTGHYTRICVLRGGPGRVILEIAKARDAVEVRINGRSAGVRVWPPYAFDLTGLLRRGQNRIDLRVTNTLGNVIRKAYQASRPRDVPAGLLGPVRLRDG